MLRMLEQAFDEITIKEEDWKAIRQSIAQQAQPSAQGANGTRPPAQAAQQPQQQPQPQQGGGELDNLLAILPPELKQQIAAILQQQGQV